MAGTVKAADVSHTLWHKHLRFALRLPSLWQSEVMPEFLVSLGVDPSTAKNYCFKVLDIIYRLKYYTRFVIHTEIWKVEKK